MGARTLYFITNIFIFVAISTKLSFIFVTMINLCYLLTFAICFCVVNTPTSQGKSPKKIKK